MSTRPTSRIARDFDLTAMSREELQTLLARIDKELEARNFEENLRREVESHMRRQDRAIRPGSGPGTRRR